MKALDLAFMIVNAGIDNNKPVSNLHLQKILYFINLIYLQDNKTFLLDRNSFEAWLHGPVVPEVYYRYSIYGGTPIIKHEEVSKTAFNESGKKLDDKEIENLKTLIGRLMNIDPWTLVDYSHRIGGAWQKTYSKSPFGQIMPDLILEEAGVNVE